MPAIIAIASLIAFTVMGVKQPFVYIILHWIFRTCEFGIAFCLIQIVKRSSRSTHPSEKSTELSDNAVNMKMSMSSSNDPVENISDVVVVNSEE